MKKLIAIPLAVILLLTMVVTAPVAAKPGVIHVPRDYATIQAAVDAASDGDTILVGAGEWDGAVVTRAVEIKGKGGAVIVDGPAHPRYPHLHYGFRLGYDAGGSGATISHFTFRGGEIGDTGQYLAFPIFAFKADNVTIEHNVLNDSLQGITNWHGSDWNISHNVLNGIWDQAGGGIGILVAGLYETPETNGNLVAHNKIVAGFPEPRTYLCTGISVLSDTRWGFPGGEVASNKVVHNNVLVTGPDTVGISLAVIGLGEPLTPEKIDLAKAKVYDNKVGFNDCRGSATEIGLNPLELGDVNTISRNLGENRGHGVVPADVFRPVPEE